MGMMKMQQLLLRAFGGGDVAADPIAVENDYWWPESRPAPAASEALDLFLSDIQTTQDSLSWLVLLGGPGNGKSALLRDLVTRHADGPDSFLQQVGTGLSTEIHHRSYDFKTDSGNLVRLVNDATIKTDGATVGADFSTALRERAHLVMSVNRGVLVEDLRRVDGAPFEQELIELLISARSGASDRAFDPDPANLVRVDDTSQAVPYIVQARCSVDGQEIVLRVISLDVCSLLEPRPEVTVDTSPEGVEVLHGQRYRMAAFATKSERLETPAGELLTAVAHTLEPMDANGDGDGNWDVDWNPFAANMASLQSTEVRSGVLRVLRAAEIIEGRLFTFRELWGTLALLYIGPATRDRLGLEHVGEHLRGYERVSAPTSAPRDRLVHLLALSRFRFSQALFAEPAVEFTEHRQPTTLATPVTDRLRRADPVLDAAAGSSTDLTDGWATPVLDALEAARFNGHVLARLEADSTAFSAMVTPFDRLLESTLLEWCNSGDREVDATMAWFGRYVLRLYALAEGFPAFGAEVLAWTKFWDKASQGLVDGTMTQRLRRLIAPPLAAGGGAPEWVVLPVFGSRVEPLRAFADDPRIVARFSPAELEIEPSTHAERIILKVLSSGEDVSIDFDYPLLREAMVNSATEAGATELGAQCTPRLERARASLLVGRGDPARWAIVDSNSVSSLHLIDQGYVNGH